jgi:hypothetical protein
MKTENEKRKICRKEAEALQALSHIQFYSVFLQANKNNDDYNSRNRIFL